MDMLQTTWIKLSQLCSMPTTIRQGPCQCFRKLGVPMNLALPYTKVSCKHMHVYTKVETSKFHNMQDVSFPAITECPASIDLFNYNILIVGEIFMFGGKSENRELISDVHAFNVATGEVRTCTSMCFELARSGAAVIGETWSEEAPIAVCGGRSINCPILHCQLYRPRTDRCPAFFGH